MKTQNQNIKSEFTPPGHLSPRAQSLWQSVVPSRCRSAARLALLQAALEALDRCDAARAAVAETGMVSTTKTTGTTHAHPLLKVERESRQQFCKLWNDLHLNFDSKTDGLTGDALGRFLETVT